MPSPTRSIHVVAAVITDARGRVLLNRRTENRDMAGLWEFPGGKRESGETSEQALVRELREELGIEADVGEWLMDVPQRYPDKHLTLEVRHVRSWKGTPRGREGRRSPGWRRTSWAAIQCRRQTCRWWPPCASPTAT